MKPVVAITIGDFNGVGPEVALKAAAHPRTRKLCIPVLIGPISVFERVRVDLKIKIKLQKASAVFTESRTTAVLDVGDGIGVDVKYGSPSKSSGRCAGLAIEHAAGFCLSGKASAMVTAPVSKEALHLAGYSFPGQTEMVALLARSQKVAMMLLSDVMRVGLVTIHVPLREVAERISKDKVVEKISIVHESMQKDFGIPSPRIAVLGLNPHAGEHGVLGSEETETIGPALDEVRRNGINAVGPFAADGFFGSKAYGNYDVVIAMYHDQGLIPLKMGSFRTGVNFSAGLSIIRTSPDHGTAYDLAGKGKAGIDSMLEAIRVAVEISRRRHD